MNSFIKLLIFLTLYHRRHCQILIQQITNLHGALDINCSKRKCAALDWCLLTFPVYIYIYIYRLLLIFCSLHAASGIKSLAMLILAYAPDMQASKPHSDNAFSMDDALIVCLGAIAFKWLHYAQSIHSSYHHQRRL